MGTSSATVMDFVAGRRGADRKSASPFRSVSRSSVFGGFETESKGLEFGLFGKPDRTGTLAGGHGRQGQERV